ncbi:hypothetical protein [Actinomyces provencensis]|uniref:hypothetical protein n=1 Tax=Actinomyces provencensis TaxID=1720198 RepID=UPI0012B63950|nr:hypothetical protein [Actinomyces provencensis]
MAECPVIGRVMWRTPGSGEGGTDWSHSASTWMMRESTSRSALSSAMVGEWG